MTKAPTVSLCLSLVHLNSHVSTWLLVVSRTQGRSGVLGVTRHQVWICLRRFPLLSTLAVIGASLPSAPGQSGFPHPPNTLLAPLSSVPVSCVSDPLSGLHPPDLHSGLHPPNPAPVSVPPTFALSSIPPTFALASIPPTPALASVPLTHTHPLPAPSTALMSLALLPQTMVLVSSPSLYSTPWSLAQVSVIKVKPDSYCSFMPHLPICPVASPPPPCPGQLCKDLTL